MTEFYTWPEAARLLITFLLALCVLLQTLAVVVSYYRHPRGPSRFFENLLELGVLFQLLVCSLLHGQVMNGYDISLIAPTGYAALRTVAFLAVALIAGTVVVLRRNPWPLSVVAASCLTLPVVEATGKSAFAVLYLAAILFFLLRSIFICILRYRGIRTSISALSIKNAIDSLHSGVLFSEPDGFILLSNAQMQRLMTILSGKVHRNGNFFYNLLVAGELRPGCQKAEFEGQIVCLLPDETAWMFSKTELHSKRKTYRQVTAADITRQWNLTAELQRQNDQRRLRSEELRETIANLHTLSRAKETQKAKMRAHDILGQRLTLLLRTVRREQVLDYEVLRSLSHGLLDDLKAGPGALSPQEELHSLRQAFQSIGVEIGLAGDLPEDAAKGQLFVDIIRESVTNAVRHGFATKISVEIDRSDGGFHLRITNNGHPPRGPVIEGSGIGGMRKKVEPYGGALDVIARPGFLLKVDLPGGEADD